LIALSVLLCILGASTADAVELIFFHETGCPHCAKINAFLEKRILPNYPVEVKKFEIHQANHPAMMLALAKVYGSQEILKEGTPAIFVGDGAFHGSDRGTQRQIEQAIREAIRTQAPSPLTRLPAEAPDTGLRDKLTLGAVISAAAVDAINPCACAILVLLLGTILLASRRKRRAVLSAGLAFTAACYISYFLMGVGLFKAIEIAGIQQTITIAVSILAVILGLWNMKDYFWFGRWLTIRVPLSWQPKLKQITSNVTSAPGAFGMGIVISLFLLPCTSGPYVVIIGMLSHLATRLQAFWLLVLYNAIFVLPFVAITLAIGFGFTTTARVEMWRQEKLPKLHFITGLILFLIGITMLLLVYLKII